MKGRVGQMKGPCRAALTTGPVAVAVVSGLTGTAVGGLPRPVYLAGTASGDEV